MKSYYVYRHIRLDKNEVFYIGIGTKNSNAEAHKARFPRAFEKSNRNPHWLNVIKKTEYEVEILFQSCSIERIQNKEMEFIQLYGRRDLNTGTLVNRSPGGEGIAVVKKTGKYKVNQYTRAGEFIQSYTSIKKAAESIGLRNPNTISHCASGICNTAGGFMWNIERAKPKMTATNNGKLLPPIMGYYV